MKLTLYEMPMHIINISIWEAYTRFGNTTTCKVSCDVSDIDKNVSIDTYIVSIKLTDTQP